MSPPRRPPLVVRVVAALMRRVLPREVTDEFGDEFPDTLTERYHAQKAGLLRGFRFCCHELAGLADVMWHRPTPTTRTRTPDMLDSIRWNLRYAVRMIAKTPAVSAIAIVSLSLGIAANGMIYSVVHSWLLRPLPYANADRLTLLYEIEPAVDDRIRTATPANYFDWKEQSFSFESLIAANFRTGIITGDDKPEQISVADVSPDFFDVLGADAAIGRTFGGNEGTASAPPVVVMKETLWRNRYGGEPGTVGSTVFLDGVGHTVVGIMPETFDFLLGTVGMWVANDFETAREDRTVRQLLVVGVLRKEVPQAAAQNEMTALAERLEERFPDDNRGVGVDVMTIRENFPGRADTMLVRVLMGVVMLVLLVACVNVANLYLAKAETRQQELSIRSALGAGRGALFAQLMSESVVLAMIASGFGLLGTYWGLQWLVQSTMSAQVPVFFHPRFDGTVVAFTLLIAAGSSLAFGVSPALQGIRGRLGAVLSDGSRGGTATRSRKRMRSALVAVEFAMALAVLVGAGTLFDLLHSRLDIDPGFDPAGLVTTEVRLPGHKFADTEARERAYNDLLRELEGLPGQPDWALTSYLPRADSWVASPFSVDGRQTEDTARPTALAMSVSAGYLDTFGIPLRSGRRFGPDDIAGRPAVVIVNERFVTRHLAGSDPVGARITMFGESREVVGVARDIVQTRLSGLEPVPETVMFPVAQRPTTRTYLALRPSEGTEATAQAVREAVWRVDTDIPIGGIRSIDEHIAAVLAGPRAVTRIVFSIGLLTLALASIGVYGVMAFSVAQQTREIGIRMALGAQSARVMREMSAQGVKLAATGLVLGIPLAVFVVSVIGSALASPELSGDDGVGVLPIVLVTLLLSGVGMLACYLPARRATRVDPVDALQPHCGK